MMIDPPRPKSATVVAANENDGYDGWQCIERAGRVHPVAHRRAAHPSEVSVKQRQDEPVGLPEPTSGESQYHRPLVDGRSVARLYRWMQGVGIGCQWKRSEPPGS
uniref:Uncharacterized protein n=1 Tax=Anopheles atroparvus TaxID=41427 RepID=A0A182J8Q4_ANOAO